MSCFLNYIFIFKNITDIVKQILLVKSVLLETSSLQPCVKCEMISKFLISKNATQENISAALLLVALVLYTRFNRIKIVNIDPF